ncbi:MAG: PEGA domain-containing protein, partial [Candidatus Thermoplasmatota archaeon]|nr:PEGA domain-containing protein [Candidatus Thermoplasmatota archaeon]
TLGNSTVTSTGSTISFTETNGSYSFSISTSSNLTFSPTSGTITVAGNNVTQSVEFSATPPPSIKLYLTGSISPTNATLLINGKEVPTTNGIFNISIVPGAYEIEATMTGYQPYYKNLTILSNQTQTTHLSITLEKIYRPTSFLLIYLIIIAVVIVAIIGGVSTLILRKGRKVAEKKGE